jgi:hypothetical protein
MARIRTFVVNHLPAQVRSHYARNGVLQCIVGVQFAEFENLRGCVTVFLADSEESAIAALEEQWGWMPDNDPNAYAPNKWTLMESVEIEVSEEEAWNQAG